MAAFYDIWSFPLEMVEEARAYWIFRKVSKSPEYTERLAKHVPELRVDDLGRIFTIVNVPEEMREEREGMEDMHMAYVIDQLNSINFVLMSMRLSDVSYPSIQRVEGTWSYLVVIAASPGDVLTWGNLLGWTGRVFLLGGSAYLLDKVCEAITGHGIVGAVSHFLG